MHKLMTLAALTLVACAEAVVVEDSTALEAIELGTCSHEHDVADTEPSETITVTHAEPVRFEPVVASGLTDAELHGCLAEGDAGCAGCFTMAQLVAVGRKLVPEKAAAFADVSALGLVAAGFRTCDAGETPSMRLNAAPSEQRGLLAWAYVPARDVGGTRITWNTKLAGRYAYYLSSPELEGNIIATAAHEALHMRGMHHDESNTVMAALRTSFSADTLDEVLAGIAELGLPTWSNRYQPAN